MRAMIVRAAIGILAAAVLAAVVLAGAYSHYFDDRGLDPRSYPMSAIDLHPPQSKNGIEYYGKLRLDVYINRDGIVDRVDAGQSTVPLDFREDAVRAFAQMRWEPGRKWGFRVKTVKRIEVNIEPPPGVEAAPR